MWGLFILVMVMGTTQASNDLTFLVEDKLIKVSTVLDNDRISVVVPVNYSLALVKIQVKNAAKHLKMVQALVGDDKVLQKEYYTPMATAYDLFTLAESCMTLAQQKAYPEANRSPVSACTYVVQIIGENEFIDGLREISEIVKEISPDWNTANIKDSVARQEVLAKLRSKYQYVAGYLENEGCAILNVVNSLSIGELPENIIGSITTTPCAGRFNIDSYLIRECTNGGGNMICELEVGSPRAVMAYKTLIPLNYFGAQLYTNPNSFFARDDASRRLKMIDCHRRVEWDSTNAPTCKVKDVEAECENALDSDLIEEVIKECRFTQTAPPPITRLADDGILVLAQNARVREAGKLLQKQVPIVIYSNNPIDIDLGGENYRFGNSVKIKFPTLLFSKLTEVQIAALIKKAKNDDFKGSFSIQAYFGHISLMIQGSLGVITGVMGIVFYCRNRKRTTNMRLEPTAPVIGYERERFQLARGAGSANFRENMRMLQLEE